MPAAIATTRVQGTSGPSDLSVVAYQWDPRRVFYFVMLTPGGYGVGPFVPMINSVRKISPAEAAAIRPRIIHVVAVSPGDTVQSLAQGMAYRDFRLERFLALNGLAVNSRLVPGQEVKLVVYGTRRA
jgi:predicted Zn-dependent protease